MKIKNKTILKVLAVWFAATMTCPSLSLGQSINSQRSKPASNGNPDDPSKNPSLNPQGPTTLGDPKNPLTKKQRGNVTDVRTSGVSIDATKSK